jgi:hypothetical protein
VRARSDTARTKLPVYFATPVRSDAAGASATLRYVTQIHEACSEYAADRAYRVLRAAMTEALHEPVSPDKAALFAWNAQLLEPMASSAPRVNPTFSAE